MDNTQAVRLNKRPRTAKTINLMMWLTMTISLLATVRAFICERAGDRQAIFLKLFILVLALPASITVFAAGNASGTYYQGEGVIWSYTVPNYVPVTTNDTNFNCAASYRGGMLIARSNLNWGSAGGYYGIVVAPDVVLSLQGTANFDGKGTNREYIRLKWTFNYTSPSQTTGSYYFNTNGQITESFENLIANSDSSYLSTYPSSVRTSNGVTIYSETRISTQLYVGPNATPGTYYISRLSFQYGCGNNDTLVLSPSTITIKKRELSCSISSPSVIDFGSVNVRGRSDGDMLGVQNGNLSVSCSDQGKSSASGTISVNGERGRYTNTLKMGLSEVSGDAPAEIRGFIGPGIPQNGICDGNTSYTGWIQFTNAAQNISIGTLKTGINSIPYSFSLCSTGGSNAGKASATATINLSWD